LCFTPFQNVLQVAIFSLVIVFLCVVEEHSSPHKLFVSFFHSLLSVLGVFSLEVVKETTHFFHPLFISLSDSLSHGFSFSPSHSLLSILIISLFISLSFSLNHQLYIFIFLSLSFHSFSLSILCFSLFRSFILFNRDTIHLTFFSLSIYFIFVCKEAEKTCHVQLVDFCKRKLLCSVRKSL